MFDILTIVNAVWFATITLLVAELLNRLPNPRIRIFLPLTCAALLGLLMGMYNPGLHSGYRGQPEYLGPFLFPVLVPLLLSGTLISFMQGERTALGKRAGFFGAIVSSFLFLTLYQSGLYHRFFTTVSRILVSDWDRSDHPMHCLCHHGEIP